MAASFAPATILPRNLKSAYWDEYYSQTTETTRPLPSQFATFVAGELGGRHRVVEFGCGGGRDSLFFSAYGHDVIGVDGSEQAVEACAQLADTLGERASFLCSAIDDPSLPQRILPTDGPTAIYARFFLHAITEDEQEAFFDVARRLTVPGDLMAVEYRTIRDQRQEKVTDSHYRRFLEPTDFQVEAARQGFRVDYAVESFGFAKYKQDDAYVARCLLNRSL